IKFAITLRRTRKIRRGGYEARLVVRPSRPSAQRQRTDNSKRRRFDLLLDDFEIARRLTLLYPIDQHAQHVDIRGRAGTDMVDAERRVEPCELRRLRLS